MLCFPRLASGADALFLQEVRGCIPDRIDFNDCWPGWRIFKPYIHGGALAE